MTTKINWQHYKKPLFYAGMTGAILALIGMGAMQLKTAEPTTEPVELTENEQIMWVDAFNAQALEGGAIFTDVKTNFNDTYEVLEGEQKEKALNTFVYAIQDQAQRLNTVGMSFIQEIEQMKDSFEDVDFIEGDDFAELPTGIVKGLLFEMDKTFTTLIEQDKGQLIIGIDYDKVMSRFGEDMSEVTKNRLALIRFEQENTLTDYEAGHPDFETAWAGLDLIESLNSDTEDLFYQNEWPRLFYTRSLLGYEEASMNNEEGTLNEKAVRAMEDVIKEHPNTERAKDMQRVVTVLKKEGHYGEEAKHLIEQIVNERFSELLKEMEEGVSDVNAVSDSDE